MTKITDKNEEAYRFINGRNNDFEQIKSLDIVALVGKANTGKTITLNELIEELIQNPAFNLVETHIGRDLDLINQRLGLDPATDPIIIGDSNTNPNDIVAIFDNTISGKRIGIVTTGDTPDIVAVGLLYLVSQNVDVAVVASHLVTFINLISRINILSAQISTHVIDTNNEQLLMRNKNRRLISAYLN